MCRPDEVPPAPSPTPTPTPPPFECDDGEVLVTIPEVCADELEINDGFGCCPEGTNTVTQDCVCVDASPE